MGQITFALSFWKISESSELISRLGLELDLWTRAGDPRQGPHASGMANKWSGHDALLVGMVGDVPPTSEREGEEAQLPEQISWRNLF